MRAGRVLHRGSAAQRGGIAGGRQSRAVTTEGGDAIVIRAVRVESREEVVAVCCRGGVPLGGCRQAIFHEVARGGFTGRGCVPRKAYHPVVAHGLQVPHTPAVGIGHKTHSGLAAVAVAAVVHHPNIVLFVATQRGEGVFPYAGEHKDAVECSLSAVGVGNVAHATQRRACALVPHYGGVRVAQFPYVQVCHGDAIAQVGDGDVVYQSAPRPIGVIVGKNQITRVRDAQTCEVQFKVCVIITRRDSVNPLHVSCRQRSDEAHPHQSRIPCQIGIPQGYPYLVQRQGYAGCGNL